MTKKGRYTYLQEEQPEVPGKPEVLAQSEKPTKLARDRQSSTPAAPKQTQSETVLKQTGVLALPSLLENPAQYALPPQRKGRRIEPGLKRTDIPREQLNVRIRPELKRAAAGLAGLTGKTLGDVVEAALINYIEQAGDV
jgi:predicted HicB family RNase H-like nuclease